MAFLSAVSGFLAAGVRAPNAIPWEALILNVFDFVAHYGWRIIVFTLILKLCLYPLDFYQRYKMRKNQKITERLAPAIEKLQKQYGGNRQLFAQKQMELNRKEGYSYFSACLPMIVTMVVFIWLWTSMTNISRYMIFNQYYELYDTYQVVYAESIETHSNSEAVSLAQDAVYVRFYGDEEKDIEPLSTSFLWIKNIWAPDVFWDNQAIMSYSSFKTAVGDYANHSKNGLDETVLSDMMSDSKYTQVMSKLLNDESRSRVNGYLGLPILAVLLSLATQLITTRQQKKAGQVTATGGMATSMKVMMFVMPVMIGFFALRYSAVFTLYMVTNSATTLLFTVITSMILKLLDKQMSAAGTPVANLKRISGDDGQTATAKPAKKGAEQKKAQVVHYGRPDPNDLLKKKNDSK